MRRAFVVYTLVAAAIFLPRVLAPHAALVEALLTPRVIDVAGNVAELGSLLFGAVYATRAARRFDREDPARAPWHLLAAWFALFFAGQVVLAVYRVGLRGAPPVPSLGDAGFVLGYLALLVAAARFVRIYLGSGLPLGSPRSHALVAIACALGFGGVGVVVLAPITRLDAPLAERAIDLAYPVLDFCVLTVVIVVLRITSRFRGGRVWTVWAALGGGFVVLAVADVLFAYLSTSASERLDALDSFLFALGYFTVAAGAKLEHALLAE